MLLRKFPQNTRKEKTLKKVPKKTLDTPSGKRRPGRPGVRGSEIRGRADQYRLLLGTIWKNIRDPLLKAQSKDDVIAAFPEGDAYHSHWFVPGYAGLILQIIRESRFPKRSKTQMNFFADSLASGFDVTPRRSRDICAEQRAKDVPPSEHEIIRKEFYVECSCGYKGPASHNACRKCRAVIPPWLEPGGVEL